MKRHTADGSRCERKEEGERERDRKKQASKQAGRQAGRQARELSIGGVPPLSFRSGGANFVADGPGLFLLRDGKLRRWAEGAAAPQAAQTGLEAGVEVPG